MSKKINDGLSKGQRWRLRHPDYKKEYYKTNLDKIKIYREEFTKSGRHAACSQKYRLNKPDRALDSQLKYRYGITLAQYKELLEKQGNVCAVCKGSNPGKGRTRFLVDYNHKDNTIRGLLCHNCNASLGLLKDNVETLKNAIFYLTVTDRSDIVFEQCQSISLKSENLNFPSTVSASF